jgi:hypothetical protein
MIRHQNVAVEGKVVALSVSLDAREIGFTLSVIRKDAPPLIVARNHMIKGTLKLHSVCAP